MRLFLSLFLAIPLMMPSAAGVDWKPVSPAELAQKTPSVEKGAHAETILWEIWVTDEAMGGVPHSVQQHYLKIKVYDQRGAEMMSKVEIPYRRNTSISDISGRTTKPDGTVLELKKDSIFDRDLVKGSGVKLKAKSLAIPGVEPGVVVEYRWRERHEDELANYIELDLQREMPVQTLTCHLKPLTHPWFPYGMRTMAFHAPQEKFPTEERNGFWGVTYTNIPAFREEPRMPPEREVRAWMLIYYAEDKKITPDKYWKQYGKEVASTFKPRMKVNDEVKRTAVKVMEEASDPEEKLARLYRYCRNSIKNIDDAGAGITAADRKDRKENRSPADTIKQGMGTGLEIDLLFGALATAAGFDTRFAWVSDRGHLFFQPGWADSHFLRQFEIAVKVKDSWRFFDPASYYLPYGMLRWQEEGSFAMVSDSKEPEMLKTPISPPEKSVRNRRADLRLKEDGTIEGTVRLEYTGHVASVRRSDARSSKPEEREEEFKSDLKEQYGAAEITDVRFDNLTNADKPLVIEYHIKLPNYGQRTGKRMFVKPAFFQKNLPAVFTASERTYPIYFSYPWLESDTVTIDVGAGFELDHPDLPGGSKFADVGHYLLQANWEAKQHRLTYHRELRFGGEGKILFPREIYSTMKDIFDLIHKGDEHALTLKQSAAPAQSN